MLTQKALVLGASTTAGALALSGVVLLAQSAAGAPATPAGSAQGNKGQGNNGKGHGNGGPGVPVHVSGDPVVDLAPGERRLTYVTVSTAHGSGGAVRSVTGKITAASVPASTACAWQDIVVEGYDAASSSEVYAVSASSPARVPVHVTMRNSALNQDACKSLTATVTYAATVQG